MKSLRKIHVNSSGMTLVELMVAMVISLVLLGGVYAAFVGSTTTYGMNEQLSRMQENGRFASNILRNSILNSGYLGCLQDVDSFVSTLNNDTDFVFNYSQAVYGLEAVGTDIWQDDAGAIDPEATGTGGMGLVDPISDSDILVIRTVNSDILVELTDPMPDSSADLKVTANLGDAGAGFFTDAGGDILLVTDCEGATVFQTTGYTNSNGNMVHNTGIVSPPPGNITKDLGHSYVEGAQIMFPQTLTYYVRNNAAGEPSLYRKSGLNPSEELVEGVENMQIRYGEDTDNDGAVNSYVPADAVTDWNNILSVKVGLLLRSLQPLLRGEIDTRNYDLNTDGTDIFTAPGNDSHLRIVMGMTVGVRNRLR